MFEEYNDLLDETEKVVLSKGGYPKSLSLGNKPALLNVDVQYSFVGENTDILTSTKRYPLSAGESAWKAVDKIKVLIQEFHYSGYEVIYTKDVRNKMDPTRAAAKGGKVKAIYDSQPDEIVSEITPANGDLVIEKVAPSAFHGTPLLRFLNKLAIDTLIVTGGTTCGCVRASVVDAFSYGYRVAVVPEGVFDRVKISHRVSLLDLYLKYASLVSVEEVKNYLRRLKRQAEPLLQA